MGKNTQILCDGCNEDITSTEARPAFRLHLSAEPLPHVSGGIYAVKVYPPIKEDKYFCGISCLKTWLANKSLQETTNPGLSPTGSWLTRFP